MFAAVCFPHLSRRRVGALDVARSGLNADAATLDSHVVTLKFGAP